MEKYEENAVDENKRTDRIIRSGKTVLPYLAEIYQQLYLVPGEEGAEQYPEIVLRGQKAGLKDLSHFRMHEKDRLELVETPAGSVQVITLNERADFERFRQIMANKCVPCEIPASQGAAILDGVVNWQKIEEHKDVWLRSKAEEGIPCPDWGEEFRRFTSDRQNYRDALIVLSVGPYSNIAASVFGLEEEDWLTRSYIIRKYHECTHFICRRLFPDRIDAIWDEVAADAVGILAAFGRFDPAMEEVFLGTSETGYTQGRLENYVKEKEDPDRTAVRAHEVIKKIAQLAETKNQLTPFAFAALLEEKMPEWW